MNCPNCGQELKNDATVCFSCGEKIDYVDSEDIETIINMIINEDDDLDYKPNSNSEKTNKNNIKEEKEMKKVSVKPIKIFIASIIGIFLLSMIFSWFTILGNGAYIGYVNNEVPISTDIIIDALSEDKDNYKESFSPFELISYVKDNLDEHNKIYNVKGKEKTSVLAILNMIYIYGFILVVIMSIISIFLLLVPNNLKGIGIVRNICLANIAILTLNYISMKVTFFNIFAIRAKSVLAMSEISNRINLTKNGVAAGNSFFPYTMEINVAFFIAVFMLIIWLVLSSLLIVYKKKRDKKDYTYEKESVSKNKERGTSL